MGADAVIGADSGLHQMDAGTSPRLGYVALGVLALVSFFTAVVLSDSRPERLSSIDADQRYEGSFVVLASAQHGPELCVFVNASLPPQCRGLPLGGWDWDAVEDEETVAGTTWGRWHVSGTYDGARFTLSSAPEPPRPQPRAGGHDLSPACSDPEVVTPAHGAAAWEAMSQEFGPLEISDVVAVWVSGPPGGRNGGFVANVTVLPGSADAARDLVREHYGGPLCVTERELHGLLHAVE